MADYYGATQLHSGITSAGNSIADAIRRMGIEHQKQKASLDTVQGYLDAAKTIQVTDPKTGKPKQLFTPDQVQFVQQAIDQKHSELAGARAAALGIGKNILQRTASASAQAANAANPWIIHDGRRYMLDKSGFPKVDTAVPRNAATGQTAGQQFRQGLQFSAAQQRTMAAAQKGTAEMLKAHNITATDLFDPSMVTPGTIDKGLFVASGQPTPPPQGSGFGKVMNEIAGAFGGQATIDSSPSPEATPAPTPSHVQVGKIDPTYTQTADGKYRVADKGRPGALLTNEQFQAFQDQAAKLDPSGQGTDALQWLRNPENVKQDPALAAQVRQKLADSVAKGSAYTVQPSTSTDVESGNSGQVQSAPTDTADTTDTSDEGP